MHIHFDLENNHCVFECRGQHHELQTQDVSIGPFWSCAFAPCVKNGENKYTVTWKTWNNTEQFVEVQKYCADSKDEPWKTVAIWSYIANPQPGTSQTRQVKHRGLPGTVTVVGSRFGDWKTISNQNDIDVVE